MIYRACTVAKVKSFTERSWSATAWSATQSMRIYNRSVRIARWRWDWSRCSCWSLERMRIV